MKRHARFSGALVALAAGMSLWSAEAQAVTPIEAPGGGYVFSGNDCGGKGSGSFSECHASGDGINWAGIGSPVIVKYKGNSGALDEIAGPFQSVIDGSEFVISLVNNVLSFTYTPGAGDPNIHYFSIKQANGFALFHDADPITSASIDLSDYFPNNPGYSHITFFNSGSTPAVPEPSTWVMLLAGFFGIGGAVRSVRRREKLAFSRA